MFADADTAVLGMLNRDQREELHGGQTDELTNRHVSPTYKRLPVANISP
jgi:hypothetical protein